MADFIHLQHGAPPWEGSGHPDHHVETYHFHDIPLIGLIRQDGVNYLFRCFVGELEPVNVWSYTLVEQHEVDQLQGATTVAEFDELVSELADRPGVVAVSIDGYGIIDSLHVHDWANPTFYTRPLMASIAEFGDKLQSDIQQQTSRLVAAG